MNQWEIQDTRRDPRELALEVVSVLVEHPVCHLRLSGQFPTLDEARTRAFAIVSALRDRLSGVDGRLESIAIAVEPPKAAQVYPPETERVLLPHHDSGRSTYLRAPNTGAGSPYLDWAGESTTPHKIVQGYFVHNRGGPGAGTRYLPLVPVIAEAFRQTEGASSPERLLDWHADNIRWWEERRPDRPFTYLSLAVYLGLREEFLPFVCPHEGEHDLPDDLMGEFPTLEGWASDCCVGPCRGGQERFLCNCVRRALNMTLPELHRRFGTLVQADDWDLVIGDNLFTMHGAAPAPATRVLESIGLVVKQPLPEDWDAWLNVRWRNALSRLDWPC